MKNLNNKERELIEAIRNFRAAKGRMAGNDLELYAHQLFEELLYGDGD